MCDETFHSNQRQKCRSCQRSGVWSPKKNRKNCEESVENHLEVTQIISNKNRATLFNQMLRSPSPSPSPWRPLITHLSLRSSPTLYISMPAVLANFYQLGKDSCLAHSVPFLSVWAIPISSTVSLEPLLLTPDCYLAKPSVRRSSRDKIISRGRGPYLTRRIWDLGLRALRRYLGHL